MTTNTETVTYTTDDLAFVRAFTAAFPGGDEWWYMLEKLHKWERERALWVAAGRPLDHGNGWDSFIEAVERLHTSTGEMY